MIKLIACDVDGTLLSNKSGNKISSFNIEMIQEANKQGIRFVIASGRAYNDIIPLKQTNNLKCACVTGNGAEYIDEDGKLISNAYLPYDDALKTIEILNMYKIPFMIYTTEGQYSIEPVENVQKEFVKCSIKLNNLSYEEAYRISKEHHASFKMSEIKDYKTFLKDVSIIKIEAFDSSEIKISQVKEVFKDLQTVSYLSSFPINLEITNLSATKGKILNEAIKNLEINKEEVMVIGDNYNDISMFGIFENSVAMANGPKEVQKMAKYVTKSCEEDGVGHAIKKWGIKC